MRVWRVLSTFCFPIKHSESLLFCIKSMCMCMGMLLDKGYQFLGDPFRLMWACDRRISLRCYHPMIKSATLWIDCHMFWRITDDKGLSSGKKCGNVKIWSVLFRSWSPILELSHEDFDDLKNNWIPDTFTAHQNAHQIIEIYHETVSLFSLLH